MTDEPPKSYWLETELGDQIVLQGQCALGRDESNNIILPTSQVSRRHALIYNRDDAYWIVDLGSFNGVHVNGNRVSQPQRLQAGDRIELPTTFFTLRQGDTLPAKTVPALPIAANQPEVKASPPRADTGATTPLPAPSQRVKPADKVKPALEPASSAAATLVPSLLKSSFLPQNHKSSVKLWACGLAIAAVLAAAGYYFLAGLPNPKADSAKLAHSVYAPKPAASSTAATQGWANSLGMQFVPAGTPNVLFCIWDVRVKDYQAFVDATHPDVSHGIYVTKETIDENGGCLITFEHDPSASWKNPGFDHPQTPNDPVVGVSWNDAQAFCQWLTQKERAEKKIASYLEYRLPTDAEWTAAVGKSKYPWGDQWPPPDHAGNYCDQAFAAGLPGAGWSSILLPGNDGFAHTSPVGSFRANAYGLYDMGGNVWQWCEDWYHSSMNSEDVRQTLPSSGDDAGGDTYRVMRGGSWAEKTPEHMLSACRSYDAPEAGFSDRGFRVVIARAP